MDLLLFQKWNRRLPGEFRVCLRRATYRLQLQESVLVLRPDHSILGILLNRSNPSNYYHTVNMRIHIFSFLAIIYLLSTIFSMVAFLFFVKPSGELHRPFLALLAWLFLFLFYCLLFFFRFKNNVFFRIVQDYRQSCECCFCVSGFRTCQSNCDY